MIPDHVRPARNILGDLGGDFIGGFGALDSHIFWGQPGIPFLVLLATSRGVKMKNCTTSAEDVVCFCKHEFP